MPHVLLIDDQPDLRRLVGAALELNGYEVTEADDGEQGLALHRRPADVVLCDVYMPRKNGFETLRELRAASHVPVVMMTGEMQGVSRATVANMARLLGAAAALEKPFRVELLLDTVQRALLAKPAA